MVRKEFGQEVFTHALFTPGWPPAAWSHDRAAWTVEAKFVVNDYGLRTRMAIITETPGQPMFERRIYAQYAYIIALLEYTHAHAKEMRDVVKAGTLLLKRYTMSKSKKWVVTGSGDRSISDVEKKLTEAGFVVDQVLHEIGAITGSASEKSPISCEQALGPPMSRRNRHPSTSGRRTHLCPDPQPPSRRREGEALK